MTTTAKPQRQRRTSSGKTTNTTQLEQSAQPEQPAQPAQHVNKPRVMNGSSSKESKVELPSDKKTNKLNTRKKRNIRKS